MSADLITENIEDKDGISITLDMNAKGRAILTLCGKPNDTENFASFVLEPNEKGIADAKAIINGLQAWVNHISK